VSEFDDQLIEIALKPGQKVRSRAKDGSGLILNYNKAKTFIDATAKGTWVPPVVTPPPGPTGPTGPGPVPGPTPTRVIPAGSYGDFTISGDKQVWLFEPGAIVKGTVRLAGTNLDVGGLHTTSEQSHETPVRIEKGSSGVLHDYLIEHIGTPANGKGYSSIAANAGNAGTGWAGPWTIRDGVQDQKVYGHYGTEVWGIKSLVVEDVTFKGKGGVGAENGHMSLPRCNGFIVRNCTFDMTQGCWRVVEIVEENDWFFTDNTILGQSNTRGDTCPMALGSTGQMRNGTIQRNRIKDIKLFCYLIGSGHVITDNRLTNVAIPYQGSIGSAAQWARNDANSGPAW
jgi:hypothetical protein